MEQKVPLLNEVLKGSGRRLTRQRRLILDLVHQSKGHPDAGAIYLEARRRGGRIGQATVYRTLALFKQAGLVEEHRLGESHGHYEPVQDSPHFHFTCISCGRVAEFASSLVTRLHRDLEKRMGVTVERIHVEARGRCAKCR